MIIARTDARGSLGLDEAIKPGSTYAEAGVDVVFTEASQSREDLQAIATAFEDVYLFANMIEDGKTPVLSGQELANLGFKIVVYPLSGLKAMINCYHQLFENGTTAGKQYLFD